MINNTYFSRKRTRDEWNTRTVILSRSYLEFLDTAIIGDSFLKDFSDHEGDTIRTWASLSSTSNGAASVSQRRGHWFVYISVTHRVKKEKKCRIDLTLKYSNSNTHIRGLRQIHRQILCVPIDDSLCSRCFV